MHPVLPFSQWPGQAVVVLCGQSISLGRWNATESRAESLLAAQPPERFFASVL
jgi:hypothetical protein